MPSDTTSLSSDRTFFWKFMSGGMTASIFGVATFVTIFVYAISIEIEETLPNMIALWGTIVLFVSMLAGGGLAIGIRCCNSTLFRIIIFALPLVISIAGIYSWFYTDSKLGLAIAGWLLLPTSAIIAGCSFVIASAVAAFQNLKTV